jgi:hypothetical protein
MRALDVLRTELDVVLHTEFAGRTAYGSVFLGFLANESRRPLRRCPRHGLLLARETPLICYRQSDLKNRINGGIYVIGWNVVFG